MPFGDESPRDLTAAVGSREARYRCGVRLTDFHDLIHETFGVARADSILADHVLHNFSGKTGAQAIADGVDPRDVWRALCAEFDVPRARW